MFGKLDRQSETHIFFKQRIGKDQYRERTVRRDEILSSVRTIDAQRLAALDPDHPQAYRDYAEELAAEIEDPEARDLSMRLYLLASYLGRGSLRESGLRGMIHVSRSDRQRRRCHALAFRLLGEKIDGWMPATASNDQAIGVETQTLLNLIQALRQLRGGEAKKALIMFDQPAIKQFMGRFDHYISWKQLHQWAANGNLTNKQLSQLLKLEMAVSRRLAEAGSQTQIDWVVENSQNDWKSLMRHENDPVFLVDFSNVCHFSVNEPIYRDGSWVTPNTNN